MRSLAIAIAIAIAVSACAPAVVTLPRTDYARFLVEPGAEGEAAHLTAALQESAPKLEEYFGASALRTHNIRPVIHIYSESTNTARPGVALAQSGTADGKLTSYFAHIHLLAVTGPEHETLYGEPQDRSYLHKTLVHEYSSVMLDILTRAKGGGWTYYQAPRWFYQGFPEYLAMHYSTPHAREATRALALAAAPDNFDNPYVGGFARVEYLHEVEDSEKVLQLLASDRPFSEAFQSIYGYDEATLDDRVQAWLAKGSR